MMKPVGVVKLIVGSYTHYIDGRVHDALGPYNSYMDIMMRSEMVLSGSKSVVKTRYNFTDVDYIKRPLLEKSYMRLDLSRFSDIDDIEFWADMHFCDIHGAI